MSRKDDIVRTALAIADREGFEAVSMRRIASELGVGTMTLYTYVANKDELLFEMGEVLGAEILVPDGDLSGDWREAVRQIARRSYRLWMKHPWILRFLTDAPQLGPGFARHIEQSLQAVAGLDADLQTRQQVMNAVDAYVSGCVLDDLDGGGGAHDPTFAQRLDELAEREQLTHVRDLLATGDIIHRPVFEQGLDWLIAGVEASLKR